MSEDTVKQLEEQVTALTRDLSIVKQLLVKATRDVPTDSVAISELTAISEVELSENPQLIFEHATGTKRGYLSQLFEQLDVKDIPAAVNSADAGSGFGGFRYVLDGSTLKLYVS